MALIFVDINVRRLVIAGPAYLLVVLLFFMLRRGYVRFASAALSTGLWLIVTTTGTIGGGVYAPVLAGYFVVVLTATRITGYTPEEMQTAQFWNDITYPDDLPIALQRRQHLHAGEPDMSEYRIYAQDGRVLWLRFYSRPVWDAAQGHVVRIYGAVQDISRLKHLEQQLAYAQKMEAIGRMAGGIAHDFNNLLTVILGSADLLLHELDDTHPLRHDVEQIYQATTRGAKLTRQLLAFSRRQVLQPQVLSLNTLVASIEQMLHRLISEDICLETWLAPDLGHVRADAGQIEQIILNLAVNAHDAMPGGGTLSIETANVELDESYMREHVGVVNGRYVMLAISDTGFGAVLGPSCWSKTKHRYANWRRASYGRTAIRSWRLPTARRRSTSP